jgi:hypothetical protein
VSLEGALDHWPANITLARAEHQRMAFRDRDAQSMVR